MVALVALGGVAWYAASLPDENRIARLGIAGVLGGAIGNLIDRAAAGYVLDFVDAYWGIGTSGPSTSPTRRSRSAWR